MTRVNLLQKIFQERAESFLLKLRNANIVEHGPTVGELREKAIIESLSHIIPSTFEIASGFVIDARGTVTPQIDVLFYQKGTLSPLLLSERSVILPFELFRIGIEVKSSITRDVFEQVKFQANSLANLWNSAFLLGKPPVSKSTTMSFQKKTPPFLLVAASSSLSANTLKSELDKAEGLMGIVVFDKCILYKGDGSYEGESDLDRVLMFWSYMFNHCIDLSKYVIISEEMEQVIFSHVGKLHPELDTNDPKVQNMILEKLSTPSLIPYLYPSDDEIQA